jgi:Putative Actinobacterial Holin-X, holin superfamily III
MHVTAGADQEQSLGELVATATRDLSLLVHKEIELAKTEISAEVKRAGIGAGFLGGAGFIGLFALIFLCIALSLGIADAADIPDWAGFLIVGGAFALLAGLLGMLGLSKVVKVGPPRRTIRTVKDDLSWAKHPTVAPDPELDDLRATHRS